MSDAADREAAELLPCLRPDDGENCKPAGGEVCWACEMRPAVAAALRERDERHDKLTGRYGTLNADFMRELDVGKELRERIAALEYELEQSQYEAGTAWAASCDSAFYKQEWKRCEAENKQLRERIAALEAELQRERKMQNHPEGWIRRAEKAEAENERLRAKAQRVVWFADQPESYRDENSIFAAIEAMNELRAVLAGRKL